MTSESQQMILELLAATDQVVILADALANRIHAVSTEEAARLRQEIQKVRAVSETARDHLRKQIVA
jgi:membrane protein YdbS with pleckstrin-like domain